MHSTQILLNKNIVALALLKLEISLMWIPAWKT